MSPGSFDIAIIGAGPAGATLARCLGPDRSVLLVDRRDLEDPEPRARKACGGLVAPDAQAMLARFGLGLPREVLAGPQLFVVRTLDLPVRLERSYQRFYINIDRERFDRWLVSLVPGNVTRSFGSELVGLQRGDDGFRLSLRQGGRITEVSTRVLVGADGARSKVRGLLAPRWPHAPGTYLAVQEWYEADPVPPHFSVAFDPALTDFYGWTIPKDGSLLLGVALAPGPDAGARFQAFRARLAEHGFAFGRRLHREAHPILRPRLLTGSPPGPGNLLLIGEAGGFISPSSAEGFSYAFRSAWAAAEVLNGGLEAAAMRFGRAAAPIRRDLRAKCLKAPFMYVPPLRRLVMASGIRHLARLDQGFQG
ncbi:FAD-binding protein [uncultured Tolumonas sp.]|uniref:FAD-binding protein n=1 Tax=uncultured Tolumonas sp. TaxID=263765 RepID=UPI00292D3D3A|nr:FAD-binding protein [uncultured Tolumonas sp.]